MADSKSQSFRRGKLIEEMAPQKRAEALASTQNEELGNLNDAFRDQQAATEMVAEAIEGKGNQIISAIDGTNTRLDDVIAGSEMTAESVERVAQSSKSMTGAARAISSKISELANVLGGKLQSDVKAPVSKESTTLAAIEEKLPLPVEVPKLDELLEKLVPQHGIPEDAPFLPPPSTNEENNSKEGKEKEGFDLSGKIEDLLKVSKKGFGGLMSVTDRIAGMLFSYTVTAAAQAAKLATSIFAVVLGIDMIKVYFQYFMKKFEAGWDEFAEKFKEWGPLLEGLMTFAKNAEKMFSEKNWLGLGEAIIKGIMDLTNNLANLLMLGMAKLTAAMLRSMGFKEKADNIEGSALQTYQQKTGARLDDQDQTTLAKYQDRKDAEEFEAKQKAMDKFKDKKEGLDVAEKYGTVSKETAEEIRAGKIDDSFRSMSEEQRVQALKDRNNAQADIIRLTETIEDTMSPDATDIKNAKETYSKIKEQLDKGAMNGVPQDLNTEQLMAKLDKTMEKINKSDIVKPQPVAEREETVQAKRVDEAKKAEKARAYEGTEPKSSVVQQVNVSRTSKTQYNVPPTSVINSPGMRQATNVN